jgi:hypothetical protein
MHLLASVAENLGVMILTIAVLVGGIYLLLMILDIGLKFKSRGREEEGLAGLWQETLSKRRPDQEADRSES